MLLRTIMLVVTTSGVLAACESSSPAPAADPPAIAAPAVAVDVPTTAAETSASGLSMVEDRAQVCMVTNQFMGKPQIPVDVEGRTYYGCCEMCKARLANEPETRTAADPVTGEVVDKASAVIAQDASGAIYYFANDDNLRRYRL